MRFSQLAVCCGNLVLSKARTLLFILLRRRWGIDLCAWWNWRMSMSMMVERSLLVSESHATSRSVGVRSNVQPIESSLPQLMNVSVLRLYLGSNLGEYAWLNICSMWEKSLDEHTSIYDKWLIDMRCPMSRPCKKGSGEFWNIYLWKIPWPKYVNNIIFNFWHGGWVSTKCVRTVALWSIP